MKILLLGAAGFIGTNLTIELAKKTEDEITLVDRSKAFFKPIVSMHKFPILFFQSVLPVTKNLLEKPDTVEGFLCSFAVSCITVSMCYIGTLIIRKIAPMIIGE